MNKLETRYANRLKELILAGDIQEYTYETVKLKLAEKTWYTPDFMVILANGEVQFHETKAYMEEDANVKLKGIAEKFPAFTFILVKEERKQWVFRTIPPHKGE